MTRAPSDNVQTSERRHTGDSQPETSYGKGDSQPKNRLVQVEQMGLTPSELLKDRERGPVQKLKSRRAWSPVEKWVVHGVG